MAGLNASHEHLACRSPGLLSNEVLNEGAAGTKPTFTFRYWAMGKEMEEVLSLVTERQPVPAIRPPR